MGGLAGSGEATYYFNPTTHEETYEKPQEMMLEDELREHLAFLEQRKNAEHQVHKVEKLQLQLEELQFEKDTKFFEDSQKQLAEQEELETLRELIRIRDEKGENVGWATIAKNPYPTTRTRPS